MDIEPNDMNVIKRDGTIQPVAFDKVLERIRRAATGLSINYTRLAQLVLADIHDMIATSELDELAARQAISFVTTHPDWGTLASRIILSNCQKNAPTTFSAAMEELAAMVDVRGQPSPSISEETMAVIRAHTTDLNEMIVPENDYLLDYFGFKTLERAYLMRNRKRQIMETPQYMWLRVAVGLWGDNLERVKETYELMSTKAFTHATPTLFNAGSPRPQLSSCFLLSMQSDSIDGIFDTLKQCAQISKFAGGIGLHVHNIRAQGTFIAGTQGTSNGLVPMLRVFNNTARYVDQCFAPETLVETDQGSMAISSLLPGCIVVTSGGSETVEETGKHYIPTSGDTNCWKVVQKVVTHEYDGDILIVETDYGTIRVTPSHPVLCLMQNGEADYVEIGKLAPGTMILRTPFAQIYSTITSMTQTTYKGILYDLEIEGTHDYLVSALGIVHNGGGRRNGSFAIYLEPWHADIQSYLKLKSNTGSEEERARDLFYALWIPDIFMRRVESGEDWSLFCPHEAPGLADVYGSAFDELYERYEREGKARRKIPAQKIWSEILVSQIETGTPYLLYKDAANQKSNQMNVGTIKSSNLCVAPETYIDVYDMDDWHGIPDSVAVRRTVPICDLENKEVCVWNGDRYSKVRIVKTGTKQKLLKVTVCIITNREYAEEKGFRVLYCTEYHKFLLRESGDESDTLRDRTRVPARELKAGTKLCSWTSSDNENYIQMVLSVEDTGRYDDTYCYEEKDNHVAIFNGIMTGNCTEIMEYSSPEETAVCNLASIALPYFLEDGFFNFDKLRAITSVVIRNLNRVIDINFYPTPETKRSNMRHRPVGLGIQGLADVFAMMSIPWESSEAADLNLRIFEHMYYAAVDTSITLALQEGPYESFAGSPASKGILQPDLWNKEPVTQHELDWVSLRQRASRGMRNSLLMAPMPTASTSQILGYNECIEPFTTNIYARRTLAGEFTVVNRHLVADLLKRNLWTVSLKERIIAANGSIQGIDEIPVELKPIYKTVWEIRQKTLIDMAADRGAFICQSQSLNLFVSDPTIAKLSSMHFYAWKQGLKTGLYYLRTKSAVQAIKFTVDPSVVAAGKAKQTPAPEECLVCSA
jgi:ribonucleotide reductase alpha subunit